MLKIVFALLIIMIGLEMLNGCTPTSDNDPVVLRAKLTTGGAYEALSGVSSLIVVKDELLIIRDNSLSAYVFDPNTFQFKRFIKLFPGSLPQGQKKRKKVKPDLEAATILPGNNLTPHGGVLLIPSGSKINRHQGALIALKADGSLSEDIRSIDFADLFAALRLRIKKLNIEGAAISGKYLILAQRGNSKKAQNALIKINLQCLLQISSSGILSDKCLEKIVPVDLGNEGNIKYTFTDLFPINDTTLTFLAAAEDTQDSYLDGSTHGSLIGEIDLDGKVSLTQKVSSKFKFEGLTRINNIFYLVNDADNDDTASCIYKLDSNKEPGTKNE